MGSSAGTFIAICTGMVCLGLRSKSSGVSFSGLIATGRYGKLSVSAPTTVKSRVAQLYVNSVVPGF